MQPASLTPIPSGADGPIALTGASPTTLGSGAGSTIVVDGPGVADLHAELERRDGAWWINSLAGKTEINGVPISGPTRLLDRDEIRLGEGTRYEFATGEKRTRRMTSPAEMVARPRKRRYGRPPRPALNIPFAAIGTVLLAVLLVAGAVGVAWYGFFRAPKTVHTLSDRQATELDTLLVEAYDHVERGGTLLELGLGEGASQEFAQAVNTLALSDLRNDPLVKPRIEALEASVRAIYAERSLAVPSNYANATSPLTADQMKTASLTVDQFAAQFALMAAEFSARFGSTIVVTGGDHAEHVALYGKGGAKDISIKGMTPTEIQFLIDKAHARHIRIKDFSQDTILRRQVASAIKAGLLFEAGTGLHLHIDRFANRHDRWTTLRPGSPQRPQDFVEGGSRVGLVALRSTDHAGRRVAE